MINPGAIASGSWRARQTRQTIALLYLRDDGRPFVVHVDLAQPNRPYDATVDWDAGFSAALARYSESIAEPAVGDFVHALSKTAYIDDRRVWALMSRLGMPHWMGKTGSITIDEVRQAIYGDAAFSHDERQELSRLI